MNTIKTDTFVYLIMSHINPGQLIRLANTIRILSRDSLIFIHHDPSTCRLSTEDLAQIEKIKGAYLIENPTTIKWGEFTQVKALIRSIAFIKSVADPSWLITLSGQDYPIVKLTEFERSLSTSKFDGYFRYFKVSDDGNWPPGTGISRYHFKYLKFNHFKYYHKLPSMLKALISKSITSANTSSIIKIIISKKHLKNKIGFIRRKTLFNPSYILYGGWDWFVLNKKCLSKLESKYKYNIKLKDYYKSTHIPSESFTHTVLNNDIAITISSNPMRYVHWNGPAHSSSPGIITIDDCDRIFNSSMPFARKFDTTIDAEILDKIDTMLEITTAPDLSS